MTPVEKRAVEQLVLPFAPSEARQRRSDFLVSEVNRDAVALVSRAEWPGPVLALIGPEACGKSHLARIWVAETGATSLRADALGSAIPAPGAALLVEGADAGALPAEAERQLFHLINATREGGGKLLLTGRMPPATWPRRLPDLASRLAALPLAEIAVPDDTLLSSLLVKLAHDRQLAIQPRVLRQIADRMERSYAAAVRIVDELDRASLAEGRAISHKLAGDILDRLGRD